jgi:hypothetical protein
MMFRTLLSPPSVAQHLGVALPRRPGSQHLKKNRWVMNSPTKLNIFKSSNRIKTVYQEQQPN